MLAISSFSIDLFIEMQVPWWNTDLQIVVKPRRIRLPQAGIGRKA
jgi:hypothetical protein